MRTFTLTEFLSRLTDRTLSEKPFRLEAGGVGIPMAFRRGRKHSLAVVFHGAVNRQKRKIPYLSPFMPPADCDAHQLVISDPTMELPGTFAASWYCGHAGFPLQAILPPLLKEISAALGVKRTVYLGASSGGFAALLYSWHHHGSVAVAANPQTSFETYIQGPITRYRSECWPDLADNAELRGKIECDLPALYAKGFGNTVVYVQNTSDLSHLRTQFATFLAALPAENFGNVVCDVGFWGVHGHSGSVPTEVYTDWMRAAFEAKDAQAKDILDRHRLLMETGSAPKSGNTEHGAAHDMQLSSILADFYKNPDFGN
jgi:hypothetical protein